MGAVIVAIVVLVVLGLLVASFFVRRHRETDRPQAGWRPTDEVFNDPSTNRVVRVWLVGASGTTCPRPNGPLSDDRDPRANLSRCRHPASRCRHHGAGRQAPAQTVRSTSCWWWKVS